MTENYVLIEKRESAGILTIKALPANWLSGQVIEDLSVALD